MSRAVEELNRRMLRARDAIDRAYIRILQFAGEVNQAAPKSAVNA